MFFDIAITTADFPTAYKSFKENYFCIKLNRRVEEDETIKKSFVRLFLLEDFGDDRNFKQKSKAIAIEQEVRVGMIRN